MHDLSSMAETKAMTALLLLMPQTPMLFQGQEWAASNTFHYFADHNPELTKLIQKGRARELSQFASLAMPEMQRSLIDPAAENTFIRCKLDPTERMKSPHAEVFQMHKDLLRLRREEPTFRRVQRRGDFDGSVIAPDAFCLRFFAPNGADCMLIVNFGIDLALDIAPEPLLATPVHKRWGKIFSTEDPQYGGNGTPPVCTEAEGWFIPGRCAIVVKPMAMEIATVETRIREAGSNQAARRREKS
jgi:maltooligosyltrehalose trehalohydrolase